MGRNLVLCLDGTGNEIRARSATNVFKIVELLDLHSPDRQVVYYDPGVGTAASPAAWTSAARGLSRLGGLALGRGLRQNLGEAYTYLMNVWRPGDKVFVFGFSRGAYTARALCGMLYRVGLLRRGSEHLVPYALRVYARRPGRASNLRRPEGWDRIDRFADALSVRHASGSVAFPVDYLGVFDTVKATGLFGRDIHWPYTNRLPNVRVVRHALSIDERRRPYRECLISPPEPGDTRQVAETWFAGTHSDVGGGFADHPELGKVALRWMLEGAVAEGLLVRRRRLASRCTVSESDASGRAHTAPWIWAPAGFRRRVVPAGARVHASVRSRISAQPGYGRRIPDDVVWDEDSWPFVRHPQ
jgi:uncharacterized protein (DUF2235 family)